MTLEKVIETLRYLQREYNYDREVEVACDFAVVAVKKLAIATLSDPPAPPEGWQPIETAPKDGQFLVWSADEGIDLAWRHSAAFGETFGAIGEMEPTRWHHVPAPPAPETP